MWPQPMTLKRDPRCSIKSNAQNNVFHSVILHPEIKKRNILSLWIFDKINQRENLMIDL